MVESAPVYSATGKQVIRDVGRGLEHFADFASPAAASAVADVLNDGQIVLAYMPVDRVQEIVGVLWP